MVSLSETVLCSIVYCKNVVPSHKRTDMSSSRKDLLVYMDSVSQTSSHLTLFAIFSLLLNLYN